MNATSTHDTKRGEDVRAAHLRPVGDRRRDGRHRPPLARPERRCHRTGDWPDGDMESLLYQTLVGTWPIDARPACGVP